VTVLRVGPSRVRGVCSMCGRIISKRSRSVILASGPTEALRVRAHAACATRVQPVTCRQARPEELATT
jgi:hypothetical protein